MEERLYVTNPISSFAPRAEGMLQWERLGDKQEMTFGEIYRYKMKKTKKAPAPPSNFITRSLRLLDFR